METILSAIVIVGSSIIISIAGLWVTRRLVHPSKLQRHHDVAGFLIAIVGLIYGVLQAFVVFVVWSNFENTKDLVETESNCVADIFRIAHGFPSATEGRVRSDVRQYVNDVITYEWPAMEHGHSSAIAERSFDNLWSAWSTLQPTSLHENALYQEAITRLDDLGNCRRRRILASHDGVPPVIWVVLIFGGIATVAFTYFFGADNVKAQAGMTALLTAEIALVLYLIAAIEYPFSGGVAIPSDAFRAVSARFNIIEMHERQQP
jgi:hypothetical protein